MALQWLATLALGTAGGALFHLLRMPLPWMLGALLLTMAGALSGLRLSLPRGLRGAMMMVLGVMLGSAFTEGYRQDGPPPPPAGAGNSKP
jgi:hypothetical protein